MGFFLSVLLNLQLLIWDFLCVLSSFTTVLVEGFGSDHTAATSSLQKLNLLPAVILHFKVCLWLFLLK
jgi:hypothetical protein